MSGCSLESSSSPCKGTYSPSSPGPLGEEEKVSGTGDSSSLDFASWTTTTWGYLICAEIVVVEFQADEKGVGRMRT